MHLDSDSSFQHYMVFSINFQSTKCVFVHIYKLFKVANSEWLLNSRVNFKTPASIINLLN